MIDKELIKRNFSKYAKYYDKYCSVQNLCALKLIERIKLNRVRCLSRKRPRVLGEFPSKEVNIFSRILEIGCGTGNYTKLLRKKFPGSKIKALDISPDMIEVAKRKLAHYEIAFITADAEAIELKEQFDFISSNVSFQWFGDLEKSLVKYSDFLDKFGIILFSIFGPLTFHELNASLKELYGENILINSCNFMEKDKIENILKRVFGKVIVEEEILKEESSSLWELLTKIKYTGTTGDGTDTKGFWTHRTIDRLEEIYRTKFGKIVATYQILFYQAVK